MPEKVSPGQQDKAAAEARTAQVAAESKQDERTQQRESAGRRRPQATEESDERRAELREQLDTADSAADKIRLAREDGDADTVGAVSLNPYPAYEDREIGDLRSTAESRDVEINRDVEKAELVRLIREKDPQNSAGLDFMTLEQLRSLAGEKGVELPEEFVRAHLVTELRAADTGVNNPGQHVL